jgi:hypothetical protein
LQPYFFVGCCVLIIVTIYLLKTLNLATSHPCVSCPGDTSPIEKPVSKSEFSFVIEYPIFSPYLKMRTVPGTNVIFCALV